MNDNEKKMTIDVLNLKAMFDLVDQQAEDPGLWFRAKTISDAYLQQHLRKLHARVKELRELIEMKSWLIKVKSYMNEEKEMHIDDAGVVSFESHNESELSRIYRLSEEFAKSSELALWSIKGLGIRLEGLIDAAYRAGYVEGFNRAVEINTNKKMEK